MRKSKQTAQNSRQSNAKASKNNSANSETVKQVRAEESARKNKPSVSIAKRKLTGKKEVSQKAKTLSAEAVVTEKQASDKSAVEKRARKEAKERKKSIKALRLSDGTARKLLNMIDIGVAFHDLVRNKDGAVVDYRVREVNSALEAIIEIAADDAIGNPASKVYGKRGQAPFLKDIVESMETGEARTFEGSVRSIRGRLRFSVQPMDKNLFALLVEDASEEAKARRRVAFLGTRLKNLSAEHREVAAALGEARSEAKEMQRMINALQKKLAATTKESASMAAALQRESAKTQRLEAAVEVATGVRDNLKEITSSLSSALRAK